MKQEINIAQTSLCYLSLVGPESKQREERERACGIRVFGVGGAGRQNRRRSEGGEQRAVQYHKTDTIRYGDVWYGPEPSGIVAVLGIQEQSNPFFSY